jgi:hypothetical protein
MTAVPIRRKPLPPTGSVAGTTTRPLRQTCAVRLVDRRTGLTHRINGSPLVLFTRTPLEAVADLLSGRDPSLWEARVEPIGGAA